MKRLHPCTQSALMLQQKPALLLSALPGQLEGGCRVSQLDLSCKCWVWPRVSHIHLRMVISEMPGNWCMTLFPKCGLSFSLFCFVPSSWSQVCFVPSREGFFQWVCPYLLWEGTKWPSGTVVIQVNWFIKRETTFKLPLEKSSLRYFNVTGSDLYTGEESLSRALDKSGDSCPTQGRSEHTGQAKNPAPKEMFYRSGVWSSQQGLVR